MKKFLFILSISLFIQCSSDDDSSATGCTDPQAVNYNVDATESDNSCQYSIVGDWAVVNYKLSDGTDLMADYSYILYEINSDNTFYQEAANLNGYIVIAIDGTYSISSNKNQITFYSGVTDPSTATIVSIDYNNTILTLPVGSLTATIELSRI